MSIGMAAWATSPRTPKKPKVQIAQEKPAPAPVIIAFSTPPGGPIETAYNPWCGPSGPNSIGCECVVAELLFIENISNGSWQEVGSCCTPAAYPCGYGGVLEWKSSLTPTVRGATYKYGIGFYSGTCQKAGNLMAANYTVFEN